VTDVTARARVFGTVADLYDRVRPGYPDRLVEDTLAYTGGARRLLEVGGGTGKATRPFARRGVAITVLEPDAAMAAVLTRRSEPAWPVSVEVTTFEGYAGSAEPFDLIYCAQAWHWTDPETRWARAAGLLRPGGALALFWHHAWITDPAVRERFLEVMRRLAPSVDPAEHHPDDPDTDLRAHWPYPELARRVEFTGLTERAYRSPRPMSTADFLAYLDTTSAYRILPDATRARVFAELTGALPGGVELTDDIALYLARRG
jgi:SAM-dependent methyltransferase